MGSSEREIRVRVVKEEMVRPATRRQKKTKGGEEEEEEEMFLSGIDIMFRQNPHNRRLLFYEGMGKGMDKSMGRGMGMGMDKSMGMGMDMDKSMGMGMDMDKSMGMGMDMDKSMGMGMGMDMVETLKRSLALALDAFYPLAGRLKPVTAPAHAHHGARLCLDCNDSGAAFLEATVEGGITLADLQHDGAFSGSQPAFFDQLVPKVNPIEYASVPPLFIQVSRFDCGGIALGIAQSHVICDGTSLWHFMNSWAECARGEPISMPPMHARSLLKVENPSTDKAMLNLEHVEDEERVVDKGNHIKLNTFRFRKGTIDMLKTKVHEKNTSYEMICAHIWKHTTKARRHMRDKKVGFISIVNMRGRVEPPLGDAYFGNALMWTIAVATVGELEDEDLAATTQRIHRSILACNTDAFYSFLYWLEIYDRDAIFKTCMLNGARIRASSSPNFPIFRLDFGWGKPYIARCPSAEDAGKIIFFPGSDVRGNIDVVLALPMEIMHRLESDDAFTNP